MFHMILISHGEDKDIIDGINNKLINTLQEDGLICCLNKAKVLVRPEDMRMYSSETSQ